LFLSQGHRLPSPWAKSESGGEFFSSIYSLMLSCWREKPAERPNFASIKENLRNLMRHSKEQVGITRRNRLSLPCLVLGRRDEFESEEGGK